MSSNVNLTYVQINEQVTLQNQDPVLNECAARLGVSLSLFWGYKTLPEYLGNSYRVMAKTIRGNFIRKIDDL